MPDIVRYVTVVQPRQARGPVGEVYAQVERELGRIVEAITMFSARPELLAANWGVFRETLLAGPAAPRLAKEAVAATVSRLNDCPYCVDAHTIMLYGGGASAFANGLLDGASADQLDGEFGELARWAEATATPATAAAARAPFDAEQTPEFVGVLVYFHFLNRVINVLLSGTLLPGPARLHGAARRMAGRTLAKNVAARHEPGLAAAPGAPPAPLPADLSWAAPAPPIADAYARLAATAETAAEQAASPTARTVVRRTLAGWRGEAAGVSAGWLDEPLASLPAGDRPAARLALLTALAPFQVTEADVRAYRAFRAGDEHLLGLVSWAALCAARHVGGWATGTPQAAPGGGVPGGVGG